MTVPQSKARADRSSARSRSDADILAAARRLFLDHGYDAVSMQGLARAAAVARQTVFNRFGSKDALFRAMVADHWSDWGNEDRIAQVPHCAPVEAHLRVVAESIVAFQDSGDQIKFQRLIVAESRRLTWIGPAAYEAGKGPHMVALGLHMAKLHAEGRLNCPHHDIAAWQFVALIQEFLVWPKVMATGEGDGIIPPVDIVISEAIATFMARYRPR